MPRAQPRPVLRFSKLWSQALVECPREVCVPRISLLSQLSTALSPDLPTPLHR